MIASIGILHITYIPFTQHALRYIDAFYTACQIGLAYDLLLVRELRALKVIRRKRQGLQDLYYWQHSPKQFSLQTVLWAFDLSTNWRGIEWYDSLQLNQLPPALRNLVKGYGAAVTVRPGALRFWPYSNQEQFLCDAIKVLARGYFLLDTFEYIGTKGSTWLERRMSTAGYSHDCYGNMLLEPIIWGNIAALNAGWLLLYVYAGLTMLYTSATLIMVYLFGLDLWMFPPLFGSGQGLRVFKVSAMTGADWHNLLKRGLLSISQSIVRKIDPNGALDHFTICVSFLISGVIHGVACWAWAGHGRMAALTVFLPPSQQYHQAGWGHD
ncbi:uncharacterized protein BDW43DRAFT_316638 [Aspergillus alliaceus]|uniref:uncharacterized protein n=1 Tax=Petromyces alliaceus TaxID=209559 RepID=UPI0012A731E4|nr:uncharacterized protein BDW43DRAFT_316638 [Aspergillus alliaceus]KAB8227660.1 hypothetical protein BDW43DRAFT_316638 [Aspergillus alliaceus]